MFQSCRTLAIHMYVLSGEALYISEAHVTAVVLLLVVLLMDEPTSALDPISTSKIEDLVLVLKKDYTIVMVTHNMQQATRVSDTTAFFLFGDIVEAGKTEELFSMLKDKRTEDYITGRFG